MAMEFSIEPKKHQITREIDTIEKCNAYTAAYGLVLSRAQIKNLVAHRFDALKQTRRMEFGTGVLEKLIDAFCDSPYISESNYEETLLELQDMFYHFKNEAFEQLSDDELILSMKTGFNGPGHGSLEYLAGTWVETLTRRMRTGGWRFEETFDFEEADEND